MNNRGGSNPPSRTRVARNSWFRLEESNLKAEANKGEGHEVTLRVEADAEDMEPILDEVYGDLGRKITVPGFRKGKVPRKVIETHVGPENIRREAIEKGLPVLYLMAVRETDIFPVSDPEVQVIELPDDGGVVFEAKVDVKPEVEVKDYKGVEIEKPDTEVREEDVQKALDEARERFATLEVAEGKAVEEGDFVLFDFKVFADGEPVGGSSGSDRLIEIGTERFLPGFDEQLVGARKGDIIDVSITFPPEYEARELAGKPGTYRTIVKEVKRKVLPPLDDDLAKEVSRFESLDEFKQDLESKIAEFKQDAAEREIKESVIEAISDRTYVDVPESMIKDQVEREFEELSGQLQQQGVTLDDYLKAMKGTRHELEKAIRKRVAAGLKNELIIDAVATAENIEISDEEAEEYVRDRALAAGGDPEELLKEIRENARIPVIKANLRISRAIDVLVENSVFKGERETRQDGDSADDEKPGASGAEEQEAGEPEEREKESEEK